MFFSMLLSLSLSEKRGWGGVGEEERGTRQNFRVVLKLENPLEGLLKMWVSEPHLLEFVVA